MTKGQTNTNRTETTSRMIKDEDFTHHRGLKSAERVQGHEPTHEGTKVEMGKARTVIGRDKARTTTKTTTQEPRL